MNAKSLKKSHWLTIVFLAAFVGVHAESPLSPRAADLLKKLEDWENEKRQELEIEISEKRKQVIKVLEQEMEAVTRNGDLDGALTIRNAIEKLEPVRNQKTPQPEPQVTSVEFDPTGTKWRCTSGNVSGNIIEFKEDGAMISTRPDGKFFIGWKWKIDAEGRLLIRISGEETEFRGVEFSRDREEFEWSAFENSDPNTFEKMSEQDAAEQPATAGESK